MLADYPMLIVVNKDHPAKTIAELVAWLKANPDKANYPTPSPVFTLPIEHFKIKTGAPAQAISYRSSNEAVTSLLSGQTAFGFVETPAVVPQVQAGSVRALAVTIPTRIPELPDVPTLAEAGVPDVIGGTWLALMAPAGTPMPIIKKLESACRQIGASDDFQGPHEKPVRDPHRQQRRRADRANEDRVAAVGGGGQIGKYQIRPIIGNPHSIRLWSAQQSPGGRSNGALPAGPVPRRNSNTE